MAVKLEGFRRAMNAALNGPELKNVEWSSAGHDFNVKQAVITRTADGLTIDGGDGHHLSHRLKYRPDDQIYYKCRVTNDGKVEGLEVNIKSSLDTLKEWFKEAGALVAVVSALAKSDGDGALEPTPSSVELLDGDWRSDAEFLIANIIAAAAAREMPELGRTPVPDFVVVSRRVNPAILARFHEAKARL